MRVRGGSGQAPPRPPGGGSHATFGVHAAVRDAWNRESGLREMEPTRVSTNPGPVTSFGRPRVSWFSIGDPYGRGCSLSDELAERSAVSHHGAAKGSGSPHGAMPT